MGRLTLGILASLLAMARRQEDVALELEAAARATRDPAAREALLNGARMLRLHGWTHEGFCDALEEATGWRSRSEAPP
jgi:hypothetical protein